MMNDKLYIIGNGFDLHHNLRTSYSYFRDEYARRNQFLWKLLSDIYGDIINNDLWWSSFEEMLGKVDYLRLMKSYNGEALAPTKADNLFKNLPVCFSQWINTIDDKTDCDDLLRIDANSQFFTFNYTLLLEKTYCIAQENIWHIHNSMTDSKHGVNPIVGHDYQERDLLFILNTIRNNNPEIRFDVADMINQSVVNGAKKVKQRIDRFKDRFSDQYANIKHFVSMGFSFNEIDLPYIEKIILVNNYPDETDWTLYWHSNGERERFKTVTQILGINDERVTFIEW